MRALARVIWAEGRPSRSARLYGAAQANCPIELAPDKDKAATHDLVLAALGAQLGRAGLTTAMLAGGRLSLEQAAAEAADHD